MIDRRPGTNESLDAVESFYPLRNTLTLLEAVSRDDLSAAQMAIPNERIRHCALEAVKDIVPVGHLSLEFSTSGMSAYVDQKSHETVLRWLDMPLPEERVDIICELVGADFAGEKVKLRHPTTGRLLEAEYDIEVEEELLRDRRDMVQVSGIAMLDDESNPTELLEVTAINHVDLTPITIERVDIDDVHLVLRQPIVLRPVLSDGDFQLFEVKHPDLGIDAYARTREGLMPAILDEIAFLWQCYALDDPEKLTSDAQTLRRSLLAAFEVA